MSAPFQTHADHVADGLGYNGSFDREIRDDLSSKFRALGNDELADLYAGPSNAGSGAADIAKDIATNPAVMELGALVILSGLTLGIIRLLEKTNLFSK